MLFLILLLCTFFHGKGQSDTVYIYEDVVVYDTVYVHDTLFVPLDINTLIPAIPKLIRELHPDTVTFNANLLLISTQQTATFPLNHVILYEHINKNIKNSESMKKLSFFGVVFFAFQAMVLAQTNYEVSVGSGIWWENGKLNYVDKPYSPLINVGVFVKRNFSDKNFGFKTGIEYNYLISGSEYKFDGTGGVLHSQSGYEFEDLNSQYGEGLHNVSIPILFYYNKYRVQPFLGLNYNYLRTGLQTSSAGTNYFSVSHNIGLNIGAAFMLNELFSINLEFKHNFTSDYGESISGMGSGQSILGKSYNLKNNQSRISLVYTFKKRTR